MDFAPEPPRGGEPGFADQQVLRLSRRRTLCAFAGFGLSAAAGYGGWRWLMSRPLQAGVPWPMRRVLRLNERLSETIFRNASRMDQRAPGAVAPGQTRLNTSEGVDPSVSADNYRLHISGVRGGAVTLTLDQLKAFPQTRQTTRLCCVEGWSTWANWTGVRMADLVARYPLDGAPPYVAMSTPGNGYYVGLDLASALHPQSLLVYELDDAPLSNEHGFPVRLAIPTKYGIKNIKQVTNIEFTFDRPPDYWAERGYDWYAGL